MSPPRPPSLPARYRAIARLGAGGMGEVWQVADALADGDRPADQAMKIALPGAALRPTDPLSSEFRLLASLRHPHLARVFDAGQLADGRRYFTSELCAGGSLDGMVGRIEVADACAILAALCRALDFLATRGVAHNDVKPSNVLWQGGGDLALVDLGLAATAADTRDAAATPDAVGTLATMAPERLRGEPGHAGSDLFALGATTYWLLTGQPPARGKDARSTLAALARGVPAASALRPDVPEPLDRIVAWMLALDPRERPLRGAEVVQALADGGLGAFPLETPGTREAYALANLLVGRETELDRVQAVLREGRKRRPPQLVVIVGGAGAGKTRLCDELRVRVELDGRRTTALRPGASSEPFALASALALALAPDASAPPPPIPPALDAVAERARRIEQAIAELLDADAPRGPVFVDDLDAVDDASVEVLAGLLRRRQTCPISTLVVACRDPARAQTVIAACEGAGEAWTNVPLGPLDPSAVGRLLDSLFGRDVIPADWSARLLARSGGNPLLLRELVRGLLRLAFVDVAAGGWRWVGPAADAGPSATAASAADASDPMAALLTERLDHLPPTERAVVEALAAAGGVSSLPTVAAVVGSDVPIELAIASLCAQRLVGRDDARLFLLHEAFADVARAALPTDRRRSLHAALAAAGGGDAELAHHFAEAGSPRGGLRHALAAIARALSVGDLRAVRRLAETWRGLASEAEASRAERLAIEEAAGDAAAGAGTLAETTAAYHRALALAAADGADAARLLGKLALRHVTLGDYATAHSFLARVGARYDAVREVASARLRLSFNEGRAEDVVDEAGRLLEAADRAVGPPDPVGRCDVLLDRSVGFGVLGRFDEGLGACEEALALASNLGDRHGEMLALFHRSALELESGAFAAAERTATRCHALADSTGRLTLLPLLKVNLAEAAASSGRQARAEELLREAIEDAARAAVPTIIPEAVLGLVLLVRGQAAAARELCERVMRVSPHGAPRGIRNYCLLVLVIAATQRDDGPAASAWLGQMDALAAGSGDGTTERALASLARAFAESARRHGEAAVAAAQQAARLFEQGRRPLGVAVARFVEAEVLRSADRRAEAEIATQAAAAGLEALGNTSDAARVRALATSPPEPVRRQALPSRTTAGGGSDDGAISRYLDLTIGAPRVGGAIGAALIGESDPMHSVRGAIARVAGHDDAVLILGETGTGKELVARALHAASARAGGPLVVVNCAAIPASLAESELFGHVRGAFTGATADRAGHFEEAHGGTLFLDEIGELDPTLQAKLLRVLDDGVVRPVGARGTLRVDVRVIAATHRDLAAEVEAGRFRRDLFFRLGSFELRVPPLRERVADVPALVRHFLDRWKGSGGETRVRVSESAMARLRAYPWPGNLRELDNEVRRAFLLAHGGPIRIDHLSPAIRVGTGAAPSASSGPRPTARSSKPPSLRIDDRVANAEKIVILEALEASHGNKAAAARLVGLSRPSFYDKLQRYRLM